MTEYYARICSNTQGWKKPSGSAKDGKKTFFGQYRFGLEEWLLDPTAEIDGWQYGFLQPVNKGYRKYAGKTFAVRLYSIPGGGTERYREEFAIHRCDVLTRNQASETHAAFKRNGRIARMVRQIKSVGGDPSPLLHGAPEFESIINVRFRMEDVEELPHGSPLFRADYYSLYPIPESLQSIASYPDEVAPDTWEGAVWKVMVNAYERDPRARRECLDRWGHKCQACEMSFEQRYGPTAKGYIHVHHLKPLSKIRQSYRVNGKEDLRPVCPNCHVLLHLGQSPPNLARLKTMMRTARRRDKTH